MTTKRRNRLVFALSLLVLALPFGILPLTNAGPGDGPSFKTRCGYVGSAPNDPIVHPGMAGMSHLHDFFGNTSTGATVSFESLQRGRTTCNDRGDRASYWAPALLQNGKQVVPDGIAAYYLNQTGDRVVPYPNGLKMLAGDPNATSPQSKAIVNWACDGGTKGSRQSPANLPLTACPDGRTVNLRVAFPSCWDGRNLDSADHRSHMAYPPCDASHPVKVPELSMHVHYPFTGGGNVTLVSGSVWGAHMDFVNGWDPLTLAMLTQACLNENQRCR
jgi:hypothetical protein